MSASEYVMHSVFNQIVAEYHPFAEYQGYAEGENFFVVYYQGKNRQQHMVVDTEENIISDSTLGTTRSLGILTLVGAFFSKLMGSKSDYLSPIRGTAYTRIYPTMIG